MSKNIKLAFILKNRENREIDKPAKKNINYSIVDNVTYNIIESMTKFKNKEINNKKLNMDLSINLSLLLSKCDNKKNILNKKNKNGKYDIYNNYSIKNFGIYYPLNRINFLEQEKEKKIKNNENNNENNRKKIHNSINEKLDIFIPSSNIFTNIKYFPKKNDISYSSDSEENKINGKESKNSSIYEKNNKDNSIITEDSLEAKDILNISNKSLISETKKIQKNFVNYKGLIDYLECPLESNKSNKEKINNFMDLLNKIDDLIEIDEINNLNVTNTSDILDINYPKIIFDNFDIENIKLKRVNFFKDKNKEINNNNNLNNNNSEILDDSLYIINKNQKNKKINTKDKFKDISNSLEKKYKKKMNEIYIDLIKKIYMKFFDIKFKDKKKKTNDKINFVQYFKMVLLRIGITNKNIYEKILRNQIFRDKLLSFDQFIQSFDAIICDNNMENMIQKYLFLLNIITTKDFLNKKKIINFFDLIGCDYTYIENFSENLGDKLIMRYKAVYKNEEKDNISEGNYRIKKLRIVLESFFD